MRYPFSEVCEELDSLVKADLAMILETSQLALLRESVFRHRFPTLKSAMESQEVRTFLGLARTELDRFKRQASEGFTGLESNVGKLRRQAALEVCASMPLESQQRMADYLGSSVIPGMSASPNLQVHEIPFPSICKGMGMLGFAQAWAMDLRYRAGTVAISG